MRARKPFRFLWRMFALNSTVWSGCGMLIAGILCFASGLGAEGVAVPEVSETVQRYYDSGNWLWILGRTVYFALPAIILFSGLSAKLRQTAARLLERAGLNTSRRGYATALVCAYFLLYSLLALVPELPLHFYRGYVRAHEYGLSNQSLAVFWSKSWLSALLNFGIAAMLLAGSFALLRGSPRHWWLWGAACCPPLAVVFLMVGPLFNDFGRMQNRELEARSLELADRSGVPAERVLEVNKSADTSRASAVRADLLDAHSRPPAEAAVYQRPRCFAAALLNFQRADVCRAAGWPGPQPRERARSGPLRPGTYAPSRGLRERVRPAPGNQPGSSKCGALGGLAALGPSRAGGAD